MPGAAGQGEEAPQGRIRPAQGSGVDDTACVVIKFTDGTLGLVDTTRFDSKGPALRCEAVGRQGTRAVDSPPDAAGRGVGEGLSFALQMDHFVSEVCMAGAEPRVTFRQALMVNLLADAAIESKRLGQFVDFKRFAAPKLAVAGFPP